MNSNSSSNKLFAPCDPALFFSRQDNQDTRLGDLAKALDSLTSTDFRSSCVVLGYPDDEGIKLNGGRIGASQAPDEVRKILYKMTPATGASLKTIYDLGNLQPQKVGLAKRHQEARSRISQALTHTRVVSIGGGHDYGFPDGAGFLDSTLKSSSKNNGKKKGKKNPKPLVINFDAHLDVRPLDKGLTSGTPFYRLLEEFGGGQFDFVEVGLQKQCNSSHHLNWVHKKKVPTIFMDEIRSTGLLPLLKKVLPKGRRPLFISLDIDVFASSEAPGCSQSWPGGLHYADFIPAFHWLLKNYDTRLLGVYEVSPPLDQDSRTAKLAACAIYEFLFANSVMAKRKAKG